MNPETTYKIGELARMFGITSRTIRYYEELGLLEACDRNETAHRHYGEKNAVRLKRIQQLKDYGLTLAEIHELFELARIDRSGKSVRKRLADQYRQKIQEAEKKRVLLDKYIEDLSWHLEQLGKGADFYECPGAACDTCTWHDRCDMRILAFKSAVPRGA